MSEEIRLKKLSAAKKMLKGFKYWKRPGVLTEERKRKRLKLVATLSHYEWGCIP
jgi:hypothetical protein